MKASFLKFVQAKPLLVLNVALAVFYFVALLVMFQRANMYLYVLLMAGEVFHLWQLVSFVHAAWETRHRSRFSSDFREAVDIYITVAGEPKSVVAQTLRAAVDIDYPNFHVYILNDGLVTKQYNWQEVEELAAEYDPEKVNCITRTAPGGAKAGNINHALSQTMAPFVAILDCDHIPHKDFLKQMMGYFIDPKVAFVQSPQYYRNHQESYVANAAWQQQTLFFGPICQGKDRNNAVFMCGTNMVIRRQALETVGGMSQVSITEDLMTALFIHAKGWRSIYVPKVLAEGLAPADLGTYWQQQFRWARGSMEVLTKYNPLFMRGLSWQQRVQYMASATFYLTGFVVCMDALLPLFYFYFGLVPVTATTMSIALVFLPFMFVTLYVLQVVGNFAFSFRAIAITIASWPIYLSAFMVTILRIPSGFTVTAKERQGGNYIMLASFHIVYILAIVFGIWLAFSRQGLNSSLLTNVSWAVLYIILFLPFVRAAIPDRLAKLLTFSEELPAEELNYD